MPIHRLTASSPYVQVSLFANGHSGDFIALIDTGATMTSLHPDVIKDFDPQIIGLVDVKQVGTESETAPTYYLAMVFDNTPPAIGIEVVSAVPASPCRMLIGRDLTSRWLMSWDGEGDRLLISH